MERKLYIINNGLKDLRGHYFETSVSIAEASRSLGLRRILASHATCPRHLAPDGIAFHPVFTTDHWMSQPPPPESTTIGAPPPVASPRADAARIVGHARWLLRQLTPPFLWSILRALRVHWLGPATAPCAPGPLAALLADAGNVAEADYCARFGRDLEGLLSTTACSPRDHVFLPTAHARELVAILSLISKWPAGSAPTFHLEFRHDPCVAEDGTLDEANGYGRALRTFFRHARTFRIDCRVRLYTDTDALSAEYARLAGLEFGVLPIPFRAHLLARRHRGSEPLCLGYLGDVRDEKGFQWLPDLVAALIDDVRAYRVRFLIQGSLIHPENEPQSARALARLMMYPPEFVRLVGLDGPLGTESYYRLVSEADVLLCPYDPTIYRHRSSGTLTEAIAAGIPTIVPRGSWLAGQQPPGSGETFSDRESFIEAARMVCDDYPAYHAHARSARHCWLDRHSPERLVRTLLGKADESPRIAGKVA